VPARPYPSTQRRHLIEPHRRAGRPAFRDPALSAATRPEVTIRRHASYPAPSRTRPLITDQTAHHGPDRSITDRTAHHGPDQALSAAADTDHTRTIAAHPRQRHG